MGVMSRRVVPVCGNLCFFCPSLRARSRQPVKRYKKLIAEILPRNQEAEPNDRKIGKLCEYASKNPLRIPKITSALEQRFYKELRHENFGSVKVVLCIYRKLLSSCKEQMPLFASSLLEIVRALLEQSKQVELQVLACTTLVDFISNQMDGTYMFNLEGLIPKLCQLAEDVGEGERTLHLRSVGLQALASMVLFMGEQSHISMEFDNIVSVVLENYIDSEINMENSNDDLKRDGNSSTFPDDSVKISSGSLSTKPEMHPSVDISRSPSYWSRICLLNMAKLAKEATTVRRVLEPLFHNFDVNNKWSLEKGNAYPVLLYLQCLLEETGENSHVLLSMLIKHLDHKNVSKQPLIQIDIVKVATKLGETAKQQVSIAIMGAISDLMKHFRKCLQNSAESASAQDGSLKLNADLQFSIEKCIAQLSQKVGDVGPILDSMAVFLENLSSTTVIARTTISAVHRTAQISSSIPNVSYHKKAFPDALFHQLLIAMAHPDHETRVGAHSVFSIVLMPSLLSPCFDQKTVEFVGGTEKMNEISDHQDEGKYREGSMDERSMEEGSQAVDPVEKQFVKRNSRGHSISFKTSVTEGRSLPSLRLSSHQIGLLLSSIWIQATSAENLPANFEAMAHAYNIALLFTRSKASSHMALVRCFQLAFSLRRIALDQEGGLQPSRQRSLFNLASCMLIFSVRAGNLPELVPLVKASLTEKTADPYLQLVDDIRLQAVSIEPDSGKIPYGSVEDNVAASKSLSAVDLDDNQLKETLISQLMTKFIKLSEDDLSGMKKQLQQEFSPDDSYPLGGPLFMETPRPCSPLFQMEINPFDEILSEAALTDDEAFSDPNGSQSDSKTSHSINAHGILSVNELLQSVLETAQQVANSQVLSTPVPYDEMRNQCEALVSGKQQKMSILQSFKHQPISRTFPSENEKKSTSVLDLKIDEDDPRKNSRDHIPVHNQLALISQESGKSSLRLPPSSPYDKFLKAAEF